MILSRERRHLTKYYPFYDDAEKAALKIIILLISQDEKNEKNIDMMYNLIELFFPSFISTLKSSNFWESDKISITVKMIETED